MRPIAPHPAEPALPLPRARSQQRRQRVEANVFSSIDVAHFNTVLHEINPDAPHLDPDAIACVARWLSAQDKPQAQALLQARLGRLTELQALVADPDWQVEEPVRQRIEKLVAYAEQSADLIPDSIPSLEKLDDALLVELAWPAVADELDDYRDFCRFREESGHLYLGRPERDDWLTTRLEEGALWEQLHRIRSRAYIDTPTFNHDSLFRVS